MFAEQVTVVIVAALYPLGRYFGSLYPASDRLRSIAWNAGRDSGDHLTRTIGIS
jgi:hypothetical protein